MDFTGKHVLLLTSTNLACNPRCLKEARLLHDKKVKVTVLGFRLHNWTDEKEAGIRKSLPGVSFHYIDAVKKDRGWLWSSILEKAARAVSVTSNNLYLRSLALTKRTSQILGWVRNWDGRADLVIGHNPAAFYPAYWLSKEKHIPFALDVEDYHPGEGNNSSLQQTAREVMQKCIEASSYSSFASPLIKKETETFVEKSGDLIVVHNVFPGSDFTRPVMENAGKLKFVWFSQFIDYGRGLEKVLPVLDKFKDDIQLTLLGNRREDFYDKEIKPREYILCKGPLSNEELLSGLVEYDIGLAIEDKYADLNRDICLTNKIWAYFQAGLYIVASDTTAQELFISQHPDHGLYTSLEEKELTDNLTSVINNTRAIRAHKLNRYEEALAHSWENESTVLLAQWHNAFIKN